MTCAEILSVGKKEEKMLRHCLENNQRFIIIISVSIVESNPNPVTNIFRLGSSRSGLAQAPERAASGRREDGGEPEVREMASKE